MPSDDDEELPDPEMHAALWADRAPPGWWRCSECGEQNGISEPCKCSIKEEDAEA